MRNLIVIICFTIFLPQVLFTQSISQIPNLLIWLRADTAISLSGSEVTQWGDISGNNNHFFPVTSATQPSFVGSSSMNNEPYIFFNGTKRMQTSGNFSLGNATVIVIAENNSGDPQFGRTIDHTYNFGFWIGRGSGSTVGGGFYEGSAPYGNFMSINLDQPYAITMVRDGSLTSSFRGSEPFPIPTRTTASNLTAPNKIVLGASVVGGDSGNKDIYEVIIFNRALDEGELDIVRAYLMNRYSVNVSLGGQINVIDSFCPITLTPSSGFSSYLWSTGELTPTIDVVQSGSYWVRATDQLGFYSYDTIEVSLPEIPGPVNNFICQGLSNSWSADMGPGFTYLWSTGETTPSIDITTPGTYNVTVFDAFGCSRNSGDFTFTVDNYAETAFLGNDTTLCSGNNVALQIGAPETMEYYWNGSSAGAQQPFFEVTSTGEVTLESINVNGCVAQDTIFVTVSGTAPDAVFNTNNVCYESAVAFTDLSVPANGDPIASWSWNFGDGQLSTEQSPSYMYTAPGTYNVELFVLSQGGCGETVNNTVTVHENPTAGFSFTGYCEGKTIQFSNSSAAGSAAITSYYWDFDMPWTGAYNNSTVPVPNRVFDPEGLYDVMLVVTDANNCDDTLIAQIDIYPSPEMDISLEDACQGTPVSIVNNTVTDPGSTYLWDFGDNTTSILPVPIKSYSIYGSYTVTLQVVGSNGCDASASQVVNVFAAPVAAMDLGPACVGSPLTLTDLSDVWGSEIDSVFWVVNSQDTLYGPAAVYDLQQLGQQEIEIVVTSEQGCSSSASQFVDVTESLDASFSAFPNVLAGGEPFTFTNTSEGLYLSQWNFGDGGTSFDEDPTHTYPVPADSAYYTVSLVLINLSGCTDSVAQEILVLRPFTDLLIDEMYHDDQNDNHVVGVHMVNAGSNALGRVVLTMETVKGELFTETWTGYLPAGQDSIYVFNAQPNVLLSPEDRGDTYICVEGVGYNLANQVEPDLSNNKVCMNIEGEEAVLLPLYPNPVTENAVIEVLINTEIEIGLSLSDSRGRMVRDFVSEFTALAPGLYNFTLNIEGLRKGVYYLNLSTKEGEKQTIKVMTN